MAVCQSAPAGSRNTQAWHALHQVPQRVTHTPAYCSGSGVRTRGIICLLACPSLCHRPKTGTIYSHSETSARGVRTRGTICLLACLSLCHRPETGTVYLHSETSTWARHLRHLCCRGIALGTIFHASVGPRTLGPRHHQSLTSSWLEPTLRPAARAVAFNTHGFRLRMAIGRPIPTITQEQRAPKANYRLVPHASPGDPIGGNSSPGSFSGSRADGFTSFLWGTAPG